MKHVKLFEEFINENSTFTGDEVAQYIEDITPEESDVPDYFINKFIKPNDGWELKQIKLKDLLKDKDFKDYYNSGEERYDEYEVDPNDLYNDLVVYKGQLLDGYSRATKMLRDGEKTAGAYVLEQFINEISTKQFKDSAFLFGGFFTGIQRMGIGKTIIEDLFKSNKKLENLLLYTQDDAIGFWKKIGGKIIQSGKDEKGTLRYFVQINRNDVDTNSSIKDLGVSYKNLETKKSKLAIGEYVIKMGRQKIGFFFVKDMGTIQMDPMEIIKESLNEENYQSPYIKNEKVTGKVYHVAGEPIKALNNRPMWFALEKEHSDDGWYANMIENGGAYQYSAKISGNICDVFEDRIQKLFKDNGLDTQEWETEIVGNPSAEEVMKLEGTKLLIKNGFAGAIYVDYDPRDFQQDLDALIIFDAKKSVKNWKLEKSE